MLSTGLLTTDDLDEIGGSFGDDLSLEVAAELVDAVDRGRVANQADTGYALMLAAEITERGGDLPAAQVLAERAVEAYRIHGDPDGYPRAFHAELLLRLGRDDEAMAELTILRPRLSQDADAISYISEALEEGGRADIAVQWLTEALGVALRREQELGSQRGQPAYQQAVGMAFMLAQQRRRLRRDLDLPPDDYDDLADRLVDALAEHEPDHQGMALLYWPQAEFDRLILRWPAFAEKHGQSWDGYRTAVQQSLVQWSEAGEPRVALLPGAVDELADYADLRGGDPADPPIQQGYAEQLGERSQEIAWPPGRNQACWCGSQLKYKKCCLPRGRS